MLGYDFWLQLIIVLICLFYGARKGGMALGLIGGIGLMVLIFGFHIPMGKPPVDVILTILAVVCGSASLQAAGGLDCLLQIAERVLRRHPRAVVYVAPYLCWFLTILCGTGHVVYTMLPIIYDVAIKNNIRDYFDTGVMFNNSVSFDGATDKSNFFVSLSNINNNGVYPTRSDAYNKYTFTSNGSYKVNNKLTFSSSLSYSYQKNNFVSTGQRLNPIFSLYNVPRDISITAQKDLSNPFNTPGYYFTPYNSTNPYYILKNYLDEAEMDKLWGKFQADYNIFDFLKFTYRVGMDYTIHKTRNGIPNMSVLWAGTPNYKNNSDISGQSGWTYTMDRRERLIDQDFMLNFSKPIEDFNLNAIVGLNTHERKLSIASQEVNSLDIPTWFNTSNCKPFIFLSGYHRQLHFHGTHSPRS